MNDKKMFGINQRNNTKKLSILLVCIVLLNFGFSQTDSTTYRNHQILQLANGLKVEILKTRGKGIAEECDVIYYTNKRQEGKRMWQSVTHLQEEERAARITYELNNPDKLTISRDAKPIVPDRSVANVTTVPAGNARIRGSAFQEAIKSADSLAKSRAKLNDSSLLVQMEKENAEKLLAAIEKDSSTGSSNIPDDNKIVLNPVKKEDQPVPISIIKPVELSSAIDTLTSDKNEDTVDQEYFVKSYGRPTNMPVAKVDSSSVVQNPAALPVQKPELIPDVINFPVAQPIDTTLIKEQVNAVRYQTIELQPYTSFSICDSTIVIHPTIQKEELVNSISPKSEPFKNTLRIPAIQNIQVDSSQIKIAAFIKPPTFNSVDKPKQYATERLLKKGALYVYINSNGVTITKRIQALKPIQPTIVNNNYASQSINIVSHFEVSVDSSKVVIKNDDGLIKEFSDKKEIKVAEVNNKGAWKKAIIQEEKVVRYYKVQLEGKKDFEWIPENQMRNISIQKENTLLYKGDSINAAVNETCSFEKWPSDPVSKDFSSNLAKNMIYEWVAQASTPSSKIGIAFIQLKNRKAGFNRLVMAKGRSRILYPAIPTDVFVYPVSTKYKICEQVDGVENTRMGEGLFIFFKNKKNEWQIVKVR